MLKRKRHSALSRERGNITGRFCAEPILTLFSPLALVVLLPVALAAQSSSLAPQGTPQQTVYGSGIQAPLLFEGEPTKLNQVSLSLGVSTLYDDNVFGENSHRLRDEAVSFESYLGITKQTDRMVASFDYQPFFVMYRQITQYDRANHSANLNFGYKLTSHVILRLHDNFSYQNGIYPTVTGETLQVGPASPTDIVTSIIPYTTRVLSNVSGLEVTYIKSHRTSLSLGGGYNLVKYGSQLPGQALYNNNGFNGSALVTYMVTRHTSMGVLLLHQDNTYQGGAVFGYRQRSQIDSAYLSLASHLTPTVHVTVYGGAQYIRTLGQPLETIGSPAHLQGSGGGSISKEVKKTALEFSFTRSVSGSGGLYTSAIFTDAKFGLRRRLTRQWEAAATGGAAEENASLFQLANARTRGLNADIQVTRPFLHGSRFRIAYNTWHQLSKGTLPFFQNFDRNQVSVGIDYQFKPLPLGR